MFSANQNSLYGSSNLWSSWKIMKFETHGEECTKLWKLKSDVNSSYDVEQC